jgi:hypothetical protein
METRIATFLGLQITHPLSTIGHIILREGSKEIRIPCDLNQTSRALQSAFGDEDVRGKVEIEYETDDVGVLLSFNPVE